MVADDPTPPLPPLRRADLADDPVEQFGRWYEPWLAARDLVPEAVVLSTADERGRPSSRYVLLRGYGRRGFVAFTNRNSRKCRELAGNPFAALCFGWHEHHRQVRIAGAVEWADDAESDAYWITRPVGSQVAAAVSDQSEPVADRETLLSRVSSLESHLTSTGGPVPRPAHWGGIRVVPTEIEFWQSQPNRLHDRFAYRRDTPDDVWTVTRLMP